MGLIGYSILLLLCSISILCCRKNEKREWNNGKCLFCGEDLKMIYKDKVGGRTYGCPKCGNECYIFYHVDK